MIKLTFIDKYIEETLLKENEERSKNHRSSGKLSASMLGQPIQWQILKIIGVPQDDLQEYTIRKFKRGDHVESWLVDRMIGVEETQKFVEYNNVVGYLDVLIDMSKWNLDYGILPHEIKSVSNMKYKQIQRRNEPDEHHALQGALYALALDKDHFCIDYVATDDYRVETYLLETKDYKDKVDEIVTAFNNALKEKIVPKFEAIMKWQENDKYNNYLEFKDLTPEEIDVKLKNEYPDVYKVLKG
jgi:hypothetical protein